jgi:hypothetical protein
MSSGFQTGPHWLEMAFWTSQICLTLIAAATAGFAYRQLLALKRNSDQELRIAHSNLILSLDHRFANDLFEARNTFKKAQDEIKGKVLMLYPRAGPSDKNMRTSELWATKLATLIYMLTKTILYCNNRPLKYVKYSCLIYIFQLYHRPDSFKKSA